MKKLINKLSLGLKSKFYFDYETSRNVWFRAGGKATVFCLVYDYEELKTILENIGNTKYEILGAGSNILVRDNGFDGIIFKLGKKFNQINKYDNYIEVGASILDINLSKFAQMNSIKNFEFFSGIPGSIGGAVKMNAGCFGFETKDFLREVQIIDHKINLKRITNKELDFQYRNSNLPSGSIIISSIFDYKYGNKNEINELINEIKIQREKTQPLKVKTSGSTFKNPKDNFAAKLIEDSGCKGLQVGDAYVSEKHSNFIINSNKANATQIEELGKRIIEKVYNKFDIKLEWEIKIIGD